MQLKFTVDQETSNSQYNHLFIKNIEAVPGTDVDVREFLSLITYLPVSILENNISFRKNDKNYKISIDKQEKLLIDKKPAYMAVIKIFAEDNSSFIVKVKDAISINVSTNNPSIDLTDLSRYIDLCRLANDELAISVM